MNKIGMFAVAAMTTVAAVAGHTDVSAQADGFYDVTLTTKRLAHATKTVTKSFSSSDRKGSAYDQFIAYCADNKVTELAGFTVLDLNGRLTLDVPKEELDVKKITFKYSFFDYKEVASSKSYKTKVVSETNKGVYDSQSGRVYLWNTSKDAKVSATSQDFGTLIDEESKKEKRGVEVAQTGFVAYEVPLTLHKQFVATDDGKSAGGFFGAQAVAEDGTALDFVGFTAFGTGTMKNDILNSVAGNVAMKDPTDTKFGAFGTWKLQKDSSAKTKLATDVKDVLRNKGCVELFMEKGE